MNKKLKAFYIKKEELISSVLEFHGDNYDPENDHKISNRLLISVPLYGRIQ